jgi:hypothetical protein
VEEVIIMEAALEEITNIVPSNNLGRASIAIIKKRLQAEEEWEAIAIKI